MEFKVLVFSQINTVDEFLGNKSSEELLPNQRFMGLRNPAHTIMEANGIHIVGYDQILT